MLNWLFKKRAPAAAPVPAPTPAPSPSKSPAARSVAAKAAEQVAAQRQAMQTAQAGAAWAGRVQAAAGDDTALLQIAREAPRLDLKLAALDALHSEELLKQAEREFRDGPDRRLHRAAKQRLAAVVAQRSARAAAERLIAAAQALRAQAVIPANRLVALDRDWNALDAALLTPETRAVFTELRAGLSALLAERGEREHQARRWATEAQAALEALQRVCGDPAAADDALAAAIASAEAIRAQRPADAGDALEAQLSAVLARAAAKAEARRPPPVAEPAPAPVIDVPADSAAPGDSAAPAASTDDAPTDAAASEAAPPPVDMPDAKAPRPPRRLNAEQAQAVGALLQQAEAALEDGQLGQTRQFAQEIDALVGRAALDDALRSRWQALQAELARLKAWQQWGGARVRDDLVAQAEALALTTRAAAEPESSVKLAVGPHGEAIATLRKRWTEVDRLGGASNQALWQRFDAALKTAYEPVAAHRAALKAAREENLAARTALLDGLEGLDAPSAVAPVGTAAEEPAPDAGVAASPAQNDARERLRLLEQFHAAWRQLGPVEHTVPHAARDALMQRLQAVLARVEAPLQQARRAAEQEREQFVLQAEALAAQCASGQPPRDAMPRLRELQAQWQQHARTLPLARKAEGALWTRFKAATDSVYAERQAAFGTREAEWAAHAAEREAVIATLEALPADAAPADLRRALAEAEAAWRQGGELPRQAAAGLEARFRDARAALQQRLAHGARLRREAEIDALGAALARCEQREAGRPADADAVDDTNAAAAAGVSAPPLPTAWQQALDARWAEPLDAPLADATALDAALLRLEAVLDIPSPPAWQAARRDLKLQALKEAMEGRQRPEPPRLDDTLAACLRAPRPTAEQRERLAAALAALRGAASPP